MSKLNWAKRREKEADNERGRKEIRGQEDQDCAWEPRYQDAQMAE